MKDYYEILTVQYDFYQQLYTSDPKVEFQLINQTENKLDAGMQERMDTAMSVDEFFDAMMTLHNGRTPGIDGLTVELYRTIWNEIKEPLYSNCMHVLRLGHFN